MDDPIRMAVVQSSDQDINALLGILLSDGPQSGSVVSLVHVWTDLVSEDLLWNGIHSSVFQLLVSLHLLDHHCEPSN